MKPIYGRPDLRFATAASRLCWLLVLTAALSAAAQTPDLRIVGWHVDDTTGGNSDSGLHPGETVFLQVYLHNVGTGTAQTLSGTLAEVTDHPDVEILDEVAVWPDLPTFGAPASTIPTHFEISVARTRPCAWEIPLRLDLTASGGYVETREFTLVMVDPREIDLATGAARPFYYGWDDHGEMGHEVAAGDLNGDGFDEIILAARSATPPFAGRPFAGQVAVVYSNAGPVKDLDLASPPTNVTFIHGADSNDVTGRRVDTGDLNGDGYDELIVTSTAADGPGNSRPGAGEVAIIYGGPAQLPDIDLASPPSNVVFIYGPQSSDALGKPATADLDGDGFDDLILGYPGNGPADGRALAGEVALIYGSSAQLPDIDLASPPPNVTFIFGAETGDGLGSSVTGGDLNADGFAELILPAFAADGPGNSRTGAGDVAVIHGTSSQLPDIDMASPPPGVVFIYGVDSGDLLGYHGVATGDVDGDGYLDLIAGAVGGAGPDNGKLDAGEAAVVYGSSAQLPNIDLATRPANVAFIYGADPDDNLGHSATTGDIDSDGYDDVILVGYRGDGPGNVDIDRGEAVVIHGRSSRLTDIDLVSPPSDVIFIHGVETADQMGIGLAAAKIDGDGFADLILGSHYADGPGNTRPSAGDAAVLPGAPRSRYRHDPDAFAFIDATVGTDAGLSCDDCFVSIPIGFEFDFYGRKYSTVDVSSNGYLTFGGRGDVAPGACLPDPGEPRSLIAVLWDDLDPRAGGDVFYLLQGNAPNRRLTVEWSQVNLAGSAGAATFEVTLFETSNQILLQYEDVIFGNASDNGATAVVGVQNITGHNGTAVSCFQPSVTDGSAVRLRRFAAPTDVWSDDFENGAGGWSASGIWHLVSEPACSPSSRSGTTSWYYGILGTCHYDTGSVNAGTLTSPIIPSLDQDAALSFWYRRQTDMFFDRSRVEVQGDGGGFQDLRTLSDDFGVWLFTDDVLEADPQNSSFSPLDLASYTGQNVELRFLFDTVNGIDNSHTGWMVDDVTIRACPVFGEKGGDESTSEAWATAQPESFCTGETGRVDALGSYCTACEILTYQWGKNDEPLADGTGIAYTIPLGEPAGVYDYTVSIDCETTPACANTSPAARVNIDTPPDEVGPTLSVNRDASGAGLYFGWADVAGADDYVLLSDGGPGGEFQTLEGTASSGDVGLTIPFPSATRYYLVAGRNTGCGVGPK